MYILVFLIFIVLIIVLIWPKVLHPANTNDHIHSPYDVIYRKIPTWTDLETVYNPSISSRLDAPGYIVMARQTSRSKYNILQTIHMCFNEISYIKMYYFDTNFKCEKEIDIREGDKHLEDPRVITYKGKYYVVANIATATTCTPVLLIVSPGGSVEKLIYLHSKDLPLASKEKNWCPFIHQGKLYVHTDVCPYWVIREVDEISGEVRTHVRFNSMNLFAHLSGFHLSCSTSFIEFNGNYLVCLHTKKKGERWLFNRYHSFFVKININTLIPTAISALQCFDRETHQHIQFVSGLSTTCDRQDILLGVGYGDYMFDILRLTPKALIF